MVGLWVIRDMPFGGCRTWVQTFLLCFLAHSVSILFCHVLPAIAIAVRARSLFDLGWGPPEVSATTLFSLYINCLAYLITVTSLIKHLFVFVSD